MKIPSVSFSEIWAVGKCPISHCCRIL